MITNAYNNVNNYEKSIKYISIFLTLFKEESFFIFY